MKKKSLIGGVWPPFVESKTGRIMRLIFLFLLLGLMQVTANSYSQIARLNLELQNVTIKEVLQSIESQSKFRFAYSSEFVDLDHKLNISVRDKSINEILQSLFDGTRIKYELQDRMIMLYTNDENAVVQQTRTVSGKVTESSGAPLPGVTVVVKGMTQGVITDANGNYFLSKVPVDATLVFSFVGMKIQEIPIAEKTKINVNMVEETIGIEEVVAVGYGTMKKSDLTGSIVSLDMNRKDITPNISLTQALQGYLPGVNATGGGLAGDIGGLSIRGQTSLSASDSPLIVVDGVIFNGSIGEINVNDIEVVDILKDASAAAVYGSRSANGVIIITTKKGKSEKPLFSLNMSYGFQDISTTKRTKVMNGEQYANRYVDYYYYVDDLLPWYKTNPTDASDRPVRPDVTDKELVSGYLTSEEERENYLAGNKIKWIDEVTQTAPIQNFNLSVSGKTNRTNYYLAGSYTNQKGVLVNDKFNRITLRANFENKITDWLTLGLNTSYAHLDYSGLEASMSYALIASPLANKYDSDGNYPIFLAEESGQIHPFGNTLVSDTDTGDDLHILLTGKIDVPKIKGLTYEFNYSNTLGFAKQSDFYPAANTDKGQKNNGYAKRKLSESRNWLMNNIISYSNTFDKHKINATLLYSREHYKGESSELEASNFDIELLGYNAMEIGTVQGVDTDATEESNVSYMARVQYIYNSRYLLTATFRRDGFSGFGENKKFANFPSVSLAWIATEESFMESMEWINFLKLRLSYGINGNQGIGSYSTQATMSSTTYVWDGTTAIGLYPSSLGDSNLGWESTSSENFGFDFSILNNRISGNIDLYQAKTRDVLVTRTLPAMTSYSSIWANLGGIENKGVEIGITTRNINSHLFSWRSMFIFSLNRNKLTKLYEDVSEDLGNSWFVGKPIQSLYGYTVDGVWQEQDLFDGKIISGYYPGMFNLRDLNTDGNITADDDRSVIGYGDPNYRLGLNNILTYKNLSLSFFFNSIQGGQGYYLGYNSATVAGGTSGALRVNRPAVRPYWTPTNPVNNAPAMYYAPPVSPVIYEDRSFVRLQDVSLSYNFKTVATKKLGLENLQIYLSGKNLYTWTKWSGWDPEIGDSNPMMRSVIAGVKVSF